MNLLLEIGTEEIPHWMIPSAQLENRSLHPSPISSENRSLPDRATRSRMPQALVAYALVRAASPLVAPPNLTALNRAVTAGSGAQSWRSSKAPWRKPAATTQEPA